MLRGVVSMWITCGLHVDHITVFCSREPPTSPDLLRPGRTVDLAVPRFLANAGVTSTSSMAPSSSSVRGVGSVVMSWSRCDAGGVSVLASWCWWWCFSAGCSGSVLVVVVVLAASCSLLPACWFPLSTCHFLLITSHLLHKLPRLLYQKNISIPLIHLDASILYFLRPTSYTTAVEPHAERKGTGILSQKARKSQER